MNESQEGREGTSLHPVERKICLRFHEVSFSYGNLKVLDKVSFHIHQGEFIALAGPNGSGKTTALKLILGLEKPQGGTIELFGPAGPAGDLVGYVPQQAAGDRAFPISVEEVVMMGRLRPRSRRYRPEDREAAAAAMEELGIAALARRPYAALSGGQRRRVLVARALAAKPGFLILDEPTANMDKESEERLFHTLKKLKGKTTVLIVTHHMDFVSPLTDRALCLGGGEGGAGIVQHPLAAPASGTPEAGGPVPGDPAPGEIVPADFRVLHGESLPADRCYPGEDPG